MGNIFVEVTDYKIYLAPNIVDSVQFSKAYAVVVYKNLLEFVAVVPTVVVETSFLFYLSV